MRRAGKTQEPGNQYLFNFVQGFGGGPQGANCDNNLVGSEAAGRWTCGSCWARVCVS